MSDAQNRQDRALDLRQRLLLQGVQVRSPMFMAFQVIGSTGNTYEVHVSDISSCTCPDFVKRGMPCKHIYWVLARVLRLEDRLWKRGTDFEDSEIELMVVKARTVAAAPIHEINAAQEQLAAKKPAQQEAKAVQRKSIAAQLECPICLEELKEGVEQILYCQTQCGYNFHLICFRRCKANTCPMCRAKQG